LIDGGANICIMGLLDLLVEMILIPPLPISVATKKGGILLDDCCTKRGLLLLILANSFVYYQPCYTARMPSILFYLHRPSWLQVVCSCGGLKQATKMFPWAQFDLIVTVGCSLCMIRKKRDGLYYCPVDVFTMDCDPAV
jgi:hypothetical protein